MVGNVYAEDLTFRNYQKATLLQGICGYTLYVFEPIKTIWRIMCAFVKSVNN